MMPGVNILAFKPIFIGQKFSEIWPWGRAQGEGGPLDEGNM